MKKRIIQIFIQNYKNETDASQYQSADLTTKKMNVHPTYHGCWTYNIQLSRTIPSLSSVSTLQRELMVQIQITRLYTY